MRGGVVLGYIDRASPSLLAALMNGRPVNSGTLSFTAPSGEGTTRDYYSPWKK